MTRNPDEQRRSTARRAWPWWPRGAASALIVVMLALASLWPLDAGWDRAAVAGKLEVALLELRHPLYSPSMSAERAALHSTVEPFRPGVESHLVLVRDENSELWVDGVDRVRLVNVPSAPLLWSVHHRLWLGGAADRPAWPMTIRRVAFFDRALDGQEIRLLARQGSDAAIPRSMDSLMILSFEDEEAGEIAPPRLLLPPDATLGAGGLTLAGAPARSERPLEKLARSIRGRRAFSVEIWWRPDVAPPPGRHTLLALEGDDGSRNLRLDVERDRVIAQVRSGHASRRRATDLVVNVLGYVPLGLALAWGRRGWRIVVLAFVVGLSVSLPIEGLQLFHVERVPSLLDLITNSCGAALGALVVVTRARG